MTKMYLPEDIATKINSGELVDMTPPIRHHKATRKLLKGVDRVITDGRTFGLHIRDYDGCVSLAEIAHAVAMAPEVRDKRKVIFPMIEDKPVWNCMMETAFIGKQRAMFLTEYKGEIPTTKGADHASDSDVSPQ